MLYDPTEGTVDVSVELFALFLYHTNTNRCLIKDVFKYGTY